MTILQTAETDALTALQDVGFTTDIGGIHAPTYLTNIPAAVWIAGGAGLLMLLIFSGKHTRKVLR